MVLLKGCDGWIGAAEREFDPIIVIVLAARITSIFVGSLPFANGSLNGLPR